MSLSWTLCMLGPPGRPAICKASLANFSNILHLKGDTWAIGLYASFPDSLCMGTRLRAILIPRHHRLDLDFRISISEDRLANIDFWISISEDRSSSKYRFLKIDWPISISEYRFPNIDFPITIFKDRFPKIDSWISISEYQFPKSCESKFDFQRSTSDIRFLENAFLSIIT